MTDSFWQRQTPFFLPDIGTFFNQDIQQAKQLIDSLHQAGVSVIKGEILHDPDVCLNNDTTEQYLGINSNILITENYRALIERKCLSLSQYHDIFNYAQSKGMRVIVSVYDFAGADFAKDIGCMAIKVATSNITHQPLIEHIANLSLPMIIDTGGSTLEEICRAINWAQDAGQSDILIEHSPLPPPNDVSLHNLNFMKTLNKATGLPIGLSDHHSGEEMLYAAAAMGAIVLEKGLCIDDIGDEQDSAHALKISKVPEVLAKVDNIVAALGDDVRYLPRNRIKKKARMGLIAKTNIKAGEQFNLENVTFAFPVIEIGTEHWREVSQARASADVTKGEPITWDLLKSQL